MVALCACPIVGIDWFAGHVVALSCLRLTLKSLNSTREA